MSFWTKGGGASGGLQLEVSLRWPNLPLPDPTEMARHIAHTGHPNDMVVLDAHGSLMGGGGRQD